jgi:hypothetical protein
MAMGGLLTLKRTAVVQEALRSDATLVAVLLVLYHRAARIGLKPCTRGQKLSRAGVSA